MKLHKLATVLAFGLCILSALSQANAADERSIRPFKVQVPQAALEDLRRRIAETRWPDRETVDDQS
ncbi:epoxide hydrolase N-terminal domain-containing protein, partial [Mesorhizobium sp.]